MEFLSYDEDLDPATRKHVYGQADILTDEPTAFLLGKGAWQRIVRMIPPDKQKLIPYVYRYLRTLPTAEQAQVMKEIQAGSAQAREVIDRVIGEIEQEANESCAETVVRKALDE